MMSLPLPMGQKNESVIAWQNGRGIRRAEFLANAHHLASHLLAEGPVINLCEDRYYFLVAFTATLIKGQCTLLPSNRKVGTITSIADNHKQAYAVADYQETELNLQQLYVNELIDSAAETPLAHITSELHAATVFTSGSTGAPSPNQKHWGHLVAGNRALAKQFDLQGHTIVATVPPQHMYGFETTILLPLVNDVAIHASRPFFPQEILATLEEIQSGRILVSTPTHLKACMQANLKWPTVECIISSTGPLESGLAKQLETAFQCTVYEVYGSTETGAIASRQTARGEHWRLFDGMSLFTDNDEHYLQGPQLSEPLQLNDELRRFDDGSFAVIARKSDLIKIAGNRASLADLNLKITGIAGVEDGVFILPDDESTKTPRLTAIVVAPNISDATIRSELLKHIDPIFLPRRIIKVEKLPRNETGKITQTVLNELLYRQ